MKETILELLNAKIGYKIIINENVNPNKTISIPTVLSVVSGKISTKGFSEKHLEHVATAINLYLKGKEIKKSDIYSLALISVKGHAHIEVAYNK